MKRATSPEILIPLKVTGDLPLRLQVERGLREAIQTGQLPAGSVLPSTRILAADLGVSRGVVIGAYEQLLSEGYLDARRGSATRVARGRREHRPVSGATPEAVPAFRYDFRPGVPDLSLFPRRAWLSSMRRAVAVAPNLAFDYPESRGARTARNALASYLNRVRATVAHPDRLVLCTGVAQGLRMVCQVLRQRGVRRIAVEDPGHAYLHHDLRLERIEMVPVPVDGEGLRTDLLGRTQVGAVLITPAHHLPTGAVMGPQRRAALLDWATQNRAMVIEDDYDAEYRYDREPIGALQGLAPEQVIYMGTASKTLSPALRLGWLLLPTDLVDDVARIKMEADRGSPALDQLALAHFVERGELDRHLRKTRLIYRRRRDVMVEALAAYLPELRPQGVAAGLHLMIELDPEVDEAKLVAGALARSIRLYPVRVFRSDPASGPPALLLGYGALEESVIPEAVRQLALLLRDQTQLAHAL